VAAGERLDRLAVAGETFAALAEELHAARAELRRFAHGLHPIELSDAGLQAALTCLVDRSAVSVVVAAPAERFSSAVEAAAYFTCAEALTNAAKYAHASSATVRVTVEADDLVVRVADDGVGGADATRGSGLRGLADRVEALGGSLSVDSRHGAGTRVMARIPVAR
jgi:signal transduction histidine kinase